MLYKANLYTLNSLDKICKMTFGNLIKCDFKNVKFVLKMLIV